MLPARLISTTFFFSFSFLLFPSFLSKIHKAYHAIIIKTNGPKRVDLPNPYNTYSEPKAGLITQPGCDIDLCSYIRDRTLFWGSLSTLGSRTLRRRLMRWEWVEGGPLKVTCPRWVVRPSPQECTGRGGGYVTSPSLELGRG